MASLHSSKILQCLSARQALPHPLPPSLRTILFSLAISETVNKSSDIFIITRIIQKQKQNVFLIFNPTTKCDTNHMTPMNLPKRKHVPGIARDSTCCHNNSSHSSLDQSHLHHQSSSTEVREDGQSSAPLHPILLRHQSLPDILWTRAGA